jgi:glutamyl-tRNA synthetase
VRNYLALLGWGNEESQEFFTTRQLVDEFSLERVSKSPAVFDEQKLRHINGRYLRELALDDLTARLEALTGREGLRGAAEISQEKISTLADFWPLAGFFFEGPADDPAAREKILGTPEALGRLREAREALAAVDEPWTEERLETALQSVIEGTGAKPRQVFQPIRVALAGGTISPGIFETLRLIGRDEALARIDAALKSRLVPLNRTSTAADTR